MCVIVYKPAGHCLPPKNEMKAMFNMNPDGCGFVTPSATFHSMDFNDFYKHVKAVPTSAPCIIHFRWATHGSVCLRNTHPFYDEETDVYFAHNGVLPVDPVGDTTDSETVFRSVLVPAIKKGGFYGDDLRYAVRQVIGSSKFAMMHDGHVRLFGQFVEYGGCYYSNFRHLWRAYSRTAMMHG